MGKLFSFAARHTDGNGRLHEHGKQNHTENDAVDHEQAKSGGFDELQKYDNTSPCT